MAGDRSGLQIGEPLGEQIVCHGDDRASMRTALFDPDANRRAAELLNRILGILCSVAGVLFILAWWLVRASDRHGGIFGFIAALWIGPAGPLFLLSERAWRQRWKLRWLIQGLPFAYPVAFIVLLHLLFG